VYLSIFMDWTFCKSIRHFLVISIFKLVVENVYTLHLVNLSWWHNFSYLSSTRVSQRWTNEQNLANKLLEIKHFLIYTKIMNNHIPCCTELDNTIITMIHLNQADSMFQTCRWHQGRLNLGGNDALWKWRTLRHRKCCGKLKDAATRYVLRPVDA